jgi:hypothetical protein
MTLPLAIRVNPKFQEFALDPDGESKIWRRRVTWRDFQAAALTSDLDVLFPGLVVVEGIYISLITAFAGGAVASATFMAGTTGTPNTYLAATNVFTGATVLGNVTVGAGAGLGNPLSGVATPGAVGTVRFRVTTTTANAAALTAGVLDVFMALRAVSFRTA